MTLKNKALRILFFALVSSQLFGQKKVEEKKSTFSEYYDTWAVGFGVSNIILHGDLRSFGNSDGRKYYNFGSYLYIDKMFNPILGMELKVGYSSLGGGRQSFSDPEYSYYDILYTNDFPNENFYMEGTAYSAELNAVISVDNLWKRHSDRWNFNLYGGFGYQKYNSRLLIRNYDPLRYLDDVSDEGVVIEADFGSNKFRKDKNYAKSVFLNIGVGLKYRVNRKIDIELRSSIYVNHEDHLDAAISNQQNYENYFVTGLGLVYKFGKKDKYAIWVHDDEEEEKPDYDFGDEDNDGVINEMDKEPETPIEAEVYGSGKAVDSDKDGLPDHIDKCPLVPGPEHNEGCPPDTDGDGVLDIDDVCPEERGMKETLGCPKNFGDGSGYGYGNNGAPNDVSERIFLLSKSIYFKSDSDEIKGDSYSILNEIANIMLEYPNTQFQIDGHTDDRAPAYYNMNLSERRAESVLTYLTGMGVNTYRLYSQGYGEEKPTHSNDTEQGRKFNRRVEINFIQPESEKGLQIYDKEVNITESANLIQPQLRSIGGEDTDGDGVADAFDKEPNTPVGALVYGNGVSVDTDKDGVADYMDDCPLKFGSADRNGCPEFTEPVATTTPQGTPRVSITDTDGDGVIDALDAEEDTPYGSKVYGNGVAIDTDGDGVIDIFDECPLKPSTNESGCPDKTETTNNTEVAATYTVKDSDGDGVIDELDAENNTPKGAKVYGNGVAIDTDRDGIIDLNDACPLEPGVGNGCPKEIKTANNGTFNLNDADGDGVTDALDQEPNTPKGAKVYGNGVSIDTDGDSIADHSDACPYKYGSVDKNGCPLSEDTDGDGVINIYDKEPNTPFGVKVYGNGVSMDTDNDGTPDHKDACPLSPGEDSNGGCPKELKKDKSGTVTLIDTDGDGVVDQFDEEPNTPKGAKVYGNGVAIDTDYDSIPDYSDKCPTVAGSIEKDGCPEEKEATGQLQLVDTDGDGVIDLFDKDPNTPEGALVYGNGIPIDSDRDGLPDYRDECPLKAGPVENKGCPKDVKEFDWNDSDGDGVVNEFDKEPNTPKNARVYGNGVAVDSDYDDVPDHMDDCPFKPGSVENKGCPEIKGAIKGNTIDTDQDGVIDLYDKEANTPFGVKVYSNGVAIDSDKDEVPDYKDRCPLVKGLKNNEGCPVESDLDGDGVADDDDLCPDVKGTAANKGCPDKNFDKSVSVRIEDLASQIKFARTKNTLSNETTEVLDQITKIIQEYPATKFHIEAHTDDKHNEKYSLFLSKRRANAIMKYLIDGGVEEDRLTAEGYGDENPKYPNDSDLATSELNNRIEFKFILPE
ncbi:OmpA family protein [Flavicella sediminum]|uniref:OmpA family protein n=1 Tax=Flavicella sediminum TaxID=2585141 RepID=UPI0011215119|nr:OmpA family protein [Flavicella sediminum]